ncbi:DivIVA domain-containing protein, partial [Micromonospora sp. CPCC 205546]|uniref:DivIVA domain-containing protein n=1 Tax=Micromonospora sp. CPCC 205546 TaxID=3122397 RepID=UPI002FEFD223
MGQVLLLLVVALTVAAVVFGVTVLVSGRDPGLAPAEPDGRAVPLPAARPLRESDVGEVRFDTALRGYRMAQVDHAMRRAAYDIGYKSELIGVLEAEVAALREGRTADADALRKAREQAAAEPSPTTRGTVPVAVDRPAAPGGTDVVVEPIPAFAGPTAGAAAQGTASTGRPGAAGGVA